MVKKDFSRYLPVLFVLFLLEFAAIIGFQSRVGATSDPLPDECTELPDDGKGVYQCIHAAHGHDHSQQIDDFESTHELAAVTALESCVGGLADGTYPCNNIDLLSFLPLASIGGGQGNDIWGWTDSQTGNEYALMGRTSGTAFVDISDPENPIYLGNLPTFTFSSTWRDIKVYQDHAYIVADSAGSHGMQVFDLTELRNVTSPPVTFSETAHYSNFGSAHNIVINEDSGYAYAVGVSSGGTSCSGGLHIINIQNPSSPSFVGCYSADGYTHDAQCVNYTGPDADYQGSELCFNANEDTVTIVDVSNKSSLTQVARVGYTGSEYTHQGWLTEDQRYYLLDDELDESRNGHNTHTYIWDMLDVDNPVLIGTYSSSTLNIDHNLYVKGNYIYQANYRAGLRILDLANVSAGSLTEVAYFDVYPANDNANFNGAWSSYPYFDSGVVILSGIEQGLFVLQPNLGASLPTPTPLPTSPPTPTATALPGNLIFFDDFETDQGWTANPNGSNTATTGQWERANPQDTTSGGTTLQLGTTVSGDFDLVTAGTAGSSAGTNDIDNGDTSIRSANIALPSTSNIDLTFSHYFGLLSNANADDYLRVTVVGSNSSQVVYEELGNGSARTAVWNETTVSLGSFAGDTIYLLVEAADGGSGSLVEAGIDDVSIAADTVSPTNTPAPPTATPVPPTMTPVPPTATNTPAVPTATNTPVLPTATNTPVPGSDVFFDDFESDQGWIVNPSGSDNATTGQWERANPEDTTYNGNAYQLGNTTSGNFDLVTAGAAGSSVGANDIDGGTTSVRSQNISLPSGGNLTLSFDYYLAHYSNATNSDFLRVSIVGNTTAVVFEELASGDIDAATWDSFNTNLNSFAGQTVYILIEVADAGSSSLIEAGVDDVRIMNN